MANIQFFINEIEASVDQEDRVKAWLVKTAQKEGKKISELNIILCDDDFLLEMNRKFLKHDDYTDIITFDQSEDESISGELYISFDRVKENASSIQTEIQDELRRVIIHGLLHLIGYGDKSDSAQKKMRGKEDHYLSLL